MNLNELKDALSGQETLTFILPDGKFVPAHFHITEVGLIDKNFIDCGGTVRKEQKVSLQLWSSIDFHHRLKAEKLLNIINIAEDKLGIGDHEVEVEYQGTTIGKYGLAFENDHFLLTSTQTDCLAKDNCGIPAKAAMKVVETVKNATGSCTPGGGCC